MTSKGVKKSEQYTRRKRGLISFFFGRPTILLGAIAAQVYIILLTVLVLSDHSTVIRLSLNALSAVITVIIINSEMNTGYKLLWIILIVLVPIFGFVVWYFYYALPWTRKHKQVTLRLDKQINKIIHPQPEAYKSLGETSEEERGLINYLWNNGGVPVYKENKCTYFPFGEDKWERLIAELKKARHFIFMEFFIIDQGEMWDAVLDVLMKKIKEGVEVRVLYDGTTSLGRMPVGYFAKLAKKGLVSKCYERVFPFVAPYQNNRDHRKIVIIDGAVAFTGGINLSDEYINRWERYGVWKDTAVMVTGNATDSFTYMFLAMWYAAGKCEEVPAWEINNYVDASVKYRDEYDKNFLPLDDDTRRNGGFVVPFRDNPYDKNRIGRQVYIDILNRAKKYVHIMTPYLVPDEEVLNALKYCAGRGIDTKIIIPHIPDKKIIYFIGRTFFPELLRAGVKIYEYMPGFIHAKQFLCDDKRGVIGSVNLDFRSLYLHFECGMYIYDNEITEDMGRDMKETLSMCQEITLDSYKEFHPFTRFLGRLLRVISPLI